MLDGNVYFVSISDLKFLELFDTVFELGCLLGLGFKCLSRLCYIFPAEYSLERLKAVKHLRVTAEVTSGYLKTGGHWHFEKWRDTSLCFIINIAKSSAGYLFSFILSLRPKRSIFAFEALKFCKISSSCCKILVTIFRARSSYFDTQSNNRWRNYSIISSSVSYGIGFMT